MSFLCRKGSEEDEDVVILGAHYDSISEDPLNCAPGAVDNARLSCRPLVFVFILMLNSVVPQPSWKWLDYFVN